MKQDLTKAMKNVVMLRKQEEKMISNILRAYHLTVATLEMTTKELKRPVQIERPVRLSNGNWMRRDAGKRKDFVIYAIFTQDHLVVIRPYLEYLQKIDQ